MLPVGALLPRFIGWKADENLLRTTTGLSPRAFGLWRFLLAWLCPLAAAIISSPACFRRSSVADASCFPLAGAATGALPAGGERPGGGPGEAAGRMIWTG